LRASRAASASIAVMVALGCRSGDAPSERTSKPAAARGRTASGPLFVRGPTGGQPVAPFVAAEVAKGKTQSYGVLVYVGATWCEPCQSFHRAALAGELDELLAGVHLVEFDLDADREPLESAGYRSRLIPLFAVPNTDGTASEHRIEGSIKGPEAMKQNLVPRLKAFLSGKAEG